MTVWTGRATSKPRHPGSRRRRVWSARPYNSGRRSWRSSIGKPRSWTVISLVNSLKSSATGSSSAENSAAYDRLHEAIRMAIVHAGDKSNLILDPDLDSYYLMDAALVAIPQALDRRPVE